MLSESDATVQRALAAHDSWTPRVLFPAHSDVSRVSELVQENDLSLDLKQVYKVDDSDHIQFALSEGQNEALVEAYNQGYYKVPREIESQELANTLDVSHQALPERLRRASENLIENTLITGGDKE